MKLDSLLVRGSMHQVYCEDAQFHSTIDENWQIAAVMDGCSSGKDSHFASALMVKVLRKACAAISQLKKVQPDIIVDELEPTILGQIILNQVFEELKRMRTQLQIDDLEMLSTLLLAVYHRTKQDLWINVSGDGFVSVNNEVTEINQNNMPDYLTYSLQSSFSNWIQKHCNSYTSSNVKSFAISTDGITKYISKEGKASENVAEFLLQTVKKDTLSLKEKHLSLIEENKLRPYDDISILQLTVS